MQILKSVKISIDSIRANKMRTSLTVLGIVVGIASIIMVFSAGEGIKGLVLAQVESFGTDFIESEIKIPSTKKGSGAERQNATAMLQGVQITTMTLEDMADIDKLANVKQSYGAITGQELISFGGEIKKGLLLGTSASYIDIDNSELSEGRYFTKLEDKSLAKVAILGNKVANKLFGDSDPIGNFIKIKKTKFKVIGIMEERGAVMNLDFDEYVYIPVRTMQKRLLGVDHVIYMVHQLNDVSRSEETADEIREVLRSNHSIADPQKDDFRVTTIQEMLDILSTITGALTWLLLAIVFISLIVGGVGVMNVMYVIISERNHEIGLRKAVGANSKDILKQFLTESIIITLFGGIIGILAGVVFSILISVGANHAGLDWNFIIPVRGFVVAILFSLIFGVMFGIFPAKKAANLEPIAALKKE